MDGCCAISAKFSDEDLHYRCIILTIAVMTELSASVTSVLLVSCCQCCYWEPLVWVGSLVCSHIVLGQGSGCILSCLAWRKTLLLCHSLQFYLAPSVSTCPSTCRLEPCPSCPGEQKPGHTNGLFILKLIFPWLLRNWEMCAWEPLRVLY